MIVDAGTTSVLPPSREPHQHGSLYRIHLALNRIDFATKAEPHEDRV